MDLVVVEFGIYIRNPIQCRSNPYENTASITTLTQDTEDEST
jgi:hypothetical protein